MERDESLCSWHGCEKPRMPGRPETLCGMHETRRQRGKDMDAPPKYGRPEADRFWEKVDANGVCWEWTASRSHDGYGHFKSGTRTSAHRWAYENLVGAIPEGLELDHLCRNRACVNPEHLEPVTRMVNVRRGNSGRHSGAIRAAQMLAITHCPQGHPYDGDNLFYDGSGRRCRECSRERSREYQRRRRAAA